MPTCRFCGFEITWDKNSSGRWVPVDPGGGSHFVTCLRKDLLEKYQRERRILEAEESYYGSKAKRRKQNNAERRSFSAEIIPFPMRARRQQGNT